MEKGLDEVYLTDEDMVKIVLSCAEAMDNYKLLVSNLIDYAEQPLLAYKIIHENANDLNNGEKYDETITFKYEKIHQKIPEGEFPNEDTSGEDGFYRARLYMKLEQNSQLMFKYEWLIWKPNDYDQTLLLSQNLVKVGDHCGDINQIYKESVGVKGERYIDTWIWRFFYINFFLKHIPAAVSASSHTVQETVPSGGKGFRRTYQHKVYLIREHHINLSKVSKTHINKVFTCLAWGVRGHFRHLKSGKVVFVQPYRKGKERNNPDVYVSKQYLL